MNYKVYYIDGETFDGNIPISTWNNQPKKQIKKIEFNILGQTVTLENYDGYNLLVERGAIIQRTNTMIFKVILMAKQDSQVLKIIFDFIKKKVDYKTAQFGKEYNGKPFKGWKEGIKGLRGKTSVKED